MREHVAKELCETCCSRWGELVTIESTGSFEAVFNANVYVLAMYQMQLLRDTINIYNTLPYKSVKTDATK